MEEEKMENLLMLMAVGTLLKKMGTFPANITKEVLDECDEDFWNAVPHGYVVKELAYMVNDSCLEFQSKLKKFMKENKKVFKEFSNDKNTVFNFVPGTNTTQ